MQNKYIKYKSEKLQVFYAILALVEESKNNNYLFLVDEENNKLLNICSQIYDIKIEKLNNKHKNIEVIDVLIEHKIPKTFVLNCFDGKLLFPKLINIKFSLPFNVKIDKIYFRGLISNDRIFESFKLILTLKDFYSIYNLLKNLMLLRSEFVINSKYIYFNFTKRGRKSQYKYLDEEYFSEMANYKYIFCPKGDFIWTYRFFETIQVYSYPIINNKIPSIGNFFYGNYFDYKVEAEKKVLLNWKKFQHEYYL